jgi:hypothetical protein
MAITKNNTAFGTTSICRVPIKVCVPWPRTRCACSFRSRTHKRENAKIDRYGVSLSHVRSPAHPIGSMRVFARTFGLLHASSMPPLSGSVWHHHARRQHGVHLVRIGRWRSHLVRPQPHSVTDARTDARTRIHRFIRPHLCSQGRAGRPVKVRGIAGMRTSCDRVVCCCWCDV